MLQRTRSNCEVIGKHYIFNQNSNNDYLTGGGWSSCDGREMALANTKWEAVV